MEDRNFIMEENINNWLHNLHLVLILIPSIPVLLNAQNQLWPAFFTIGLLILIQCFHYVLNMNYMEPEGKDIHIHRLCILSKIFLATLYLIITGYWFFSPLYYVVINPRNRREEIIAFLLPVLGVLVVWLPKLVNIHELSWSLISAIVVCFITILLHMIEGIVKRILNREHLLTEQMKITALNELKVKNLNRELAMKYQLADLNARLEERENIARNIHNVVGHTITSAIVSLQAYRVLQEAEPKLADDKLSAATERMRLALEEIRRAVRVLDQETPYISLKDFSQLLITELQRFSMDTEIEVSHNLDYLNLEQAIDKRYCEFLHSALTECLNNGIRHGKASFFFVFMQCDANHIELSVTDNGKGFENLTKEEQDKRISQGYGIRKIEQFVLEHGGRMKLSSDHGFRVLLELPLIRV